VKYAYYQPSINQKCVATKRVGARQRAIAFPQEALDFLKRHLLFLDKLEKLTPFKLCTDSLFCSADGSRPLQRCHVLAAARIWSNDISIMRLRTNAGTLSAEHYQGDREGLGRYSSSLDHTIETHLAEYVSSETLDAFDLERLSLNKKFCQAPTKRSRSNKRPSKSLSLSLLLFSHVSLSLSLFVSLSLCLCLCFSLCFSLFLCVCHPLFSL
jgi:hypothetical protein